MHFLLLCIVLNVVFYDTLRVIPNKEIVSCIVYINIFKDHQLLIIGVYKLFSAISVMTFCNK